MEGCPRLRHPRAGPRRTEHGSRIIRGEVHPYRFAGMAGVRNVGRDRNWTGHPLAQANLYGFGRLAWNPHLGSEAIADEWTRMTFGNN